MNARQSAPPLPPALGKATVFGFVRLRGTPALHPLQGERQVRPSPAEPGEGSSRQPTSGYAKISPEHERRRESLPRTHPQNNLNPSPPAPRPRALTPVPGLATVFGFSRLSGTPALHPLQGERQVRASSAETGEGSSGQPASANPIVCDSTPSLPPSPLRERAGVRVAAHPTTHPKLQQPSQPSSPLNPAPGGEGWSLPRTRSGGEGSSGQPRSDYAKVSREAEGRDECLPRTHRQATVSHAAGHPLSPSPLRERAGVRVAATPATHPQVQQPPAITRPLLLPLPMGEGWGEGLPPTQPRAAQASWTACLVFTVSEGRGRFRRLRRKSVRGLPRTQLQCTFIPSPHAPLAPTPLSLLSPLPSPLPHV